MNIAAPAAAGVTPMYCSTCGSRIADGRATCQVCGAVAARAPFPAPIPAATAAAVGPMYAAAQVQVCPRCGYRGIGSSYFSKGTHVALLVGSALAFFPAAAGYVILRHNHRVCPACGLGWGAHGTRALTLLPGTNSALRTSDVVLPTAEAGGGAKRGFSIALLIFGAMMMVGGLAGMEFAPIMFGMLALGGSGLLWKKQQSDREERRDAIIQSLQLPVLQLAGRKGGRLTVTDVATELGWPMVRAEKVLNSLDDGMRVMSDITDEGVIVYDFLEIRTAGLSASQKPELRLHA
ncbi:MAG TPA: hypothetical protein VFJ16_11670 [Longimicrobium sp.]|nr:hypothetical protein [Longimicrobium sp.]